MKYYQIVEANQIFKLEAEVNGYMEDGWKPQGAPYCYHNGLQNYHCQAMIKEDE